ncbi:MAG: retron system putative HNH endonuclease [Desulfatirhabdiaceae bacterium]|nr:retron system putative HNH endonuclease [Desulfatirhabdiaceae bacterium]
MKLIVKQEEPKAFIDWKAMANPDWQPTYHVLRGTIKKTVKEALMAEQGGICCYCERRLADNDSHIEHFRPQRDPDLNPLDFTNMLCSCQDQLKKGVPRHCGNLKDNWFDDALLISPLDPSCESRFAFTGDGEISPELSTDIAASETITRLGLDIRKLDALRASAIEPFLEDSLSENEMRQFVSGYLQKGRNGMYGEFWMTIRYLFGGYATA